jgi:uracil-DNA glycosylase family 4
MNKHLQLAVRNAACTACKLHTQAEDDDRCVTGVGNHRARIMIVSKNPLGDRGIKELTTYLTRAGFDPAELLFTYALKCRVWDLEAGKREQKACKPYLTAEIDAVKPEWILAMGNEALYAATGHTGIMKYRGKSIKVGDATVIPTISTAMIYRNPGMKSGFEADLKYFYRLSHGIPDDPMNTPPHKKFVMTKEDLRECLNALASENHSHVSYDLETSGYDEFQPNGVGDEPMIITMAMTMWDGKDITKAKCYAVPLAHPHSPFRSIWKRVFSFIRLLLDDKPHAIAHNGKFDNRWMRQFGSTRDTTFDTLLAAHVLNENRRMGLKPLAQEVHGVEPWAMDVSGDGWYYEADLEETLWYNLLDTWHTARLRDTFKQELQKQPRKARIFKFITIPASACYTDIERAGVWVDRERVLTRLQETKDKLASLDETLAGYVPAYWSEHFKEMNFKPSNFLRWFLFEELELPILKRGKKKDDGSPGDPSVAESVLTELVDRHPCIPLLLERAKYQKYLGFFTAYVEQTDENSRIRTTFKLASTTTGRTSSGKADSEKVTGAKNIRGVNMQQVPRDKFVKGVFGVADGWVGCFADYSQVELRVAAFLAQEPTMLAYYNNGVDIHTAMAMRNLGLPEHEITSHHRTMAKSVNFGFLFGMGWFKYIETAWGNYGIRVTEREAKAFRKLFFGEFPYLTIWHNQQRRLVREYKRVESPLGRVRHLPDIDSPEDSVRAEAERQAINSPVQSFASDMTLMAVASIHKQFKELGLRSRVNGTVHDSTISEIWKPELEVALPIIKTTMENLPLREKFGINLNVPIKADLSLGYRWGEDKELTDEQIYNWTGSDLARVISG